MPVQFFLVQTFTSHITHFLSNTFLDPSLVEKGGQACLNQRSSTYRARFHRGKVELLLAVECRALRVALRKPAILRCDTGHSVFAA